MSQRTHSAPFHRRVLPWIFVVAFLGIAPAVVFYTAGYRWNTKKLKIERNGTIILDSTPTDARLSIDGRPTQETTPITIQDMAPGLHRFRLEKDGYATWEKSLEVYSERVTFANTIWLWKKIQPVFVSSNPINLISVSPDGRTLLGIAQNTSTHALIMNEQQTVVRDVSLGSLLKQPVHSIDWSPTGRFALLQPEQTSATSTDWLLDTRGERPPLQIPHTSYHWESEAIVLRQNHSQTRISLSDFALDTKPFEKNLVDQSEDAELQATSNTQSLVFVPLRNRERGFALPNGDWTLWSSHNGTSLLRDGSRWLSFEERAQSPLFRSAMGDELRPFMSKDQTQNLLLNTNELWIWDPINEPELLYRQTEPLINAEWHRDGNDIFFATGKTLSVLNLDTRGGTILTSLTTFDQITSFDVLGKTLFIAGSKDGQSGLWSLNVE